MSYSLRRVSISALLAASVALGGCDSGDGGSEPSTGPSAGGKADDTTAGPIGALATGTQSSGYVAGDAVHVYVVEARPGSVVTARVVRTSGDLDPTAFLYRNLFAAQNDDFEGPSHGFSNTSSSMEAGWTVPSSSDLILVVGAGGSSEGEFEIELNCHEDSPLPCTEGDEDSEIAFCEAVRDAWLVCFEEAEDESDPLCDRWLGHEDTTDDDNCCDLWDAQGLPSEDFCG